MLLAYDGSPKAKEALFIAAHFAKEHGSSLVVLGVDESGGKENTVASQALDDARRYLTAHEVEALCLEKRGEVAQAIIRTVKNQRCDLILVGGYGFNPIMEVVLGSTVDQILRASPTPVLVCR
jgi:nucleotide-binding universal stress UspA family protein